MSAATASREEVLRRIRAATAGRGADFAHDYAVLSREYIRRGALSIDARIALMAERLREYDAGVVECAPADVGATIEAEIAKSGRRALVAPQGLPKEWLAPGCEWKIDLRLTHEEIEQADGVVTASTCGIADSGTIVLHHGDAEGRRALTLLPDWHLCVLKASQVVETLPEYFDRCSAPPALATFISGPSATADIEMIRVKGVHGPRFLNVVLVRDDTLAEPGAVRTRTAPA